MRKHANSGSSRTAFTLIELLVVIAIISILAAILFPVFASAREKARQSTCASNEKQIIIAMIQYSQDYDEIYPSTTIPSAGNITVAETWDWLITPYLNGRGLYYAGKSAGHGVFECPDDTATRTGSPTAPAIQSYGMPNNGGNYGKAGWLLYGEVGANSAAYSGMAGYNANCSTSTGNCTNPTAYSVAQVPQPAKTFILVEYPNYGNGVYNGDSIVADPSADMSQYIPSANYIGGGPGPTYCTNMAASGAQDCRTSSCNGSTATGVGPPSHTNGYNYGYVDGHVKWLTPSQSIGKAYCRYGAAIANGGWTVGENM